MEHLPLFKNHKERIYFLFFLLLLFTSNLFFYYLHYQKFIKNEVFQTQGKIVNIYKKERYDVLKIATKDFVFFTSKSKNIPASNLQNTTLFVITKNISFYQYLKGFYAKSFNIRFLPTHNIKTTLFEYISKQHTNKSITSFYSALFLATPVDQTIRKICSYFGISHLVAISGFHLGVISFILYFILHLFYNTLHQKYFPYRNKRFDIMVVISCILFSYLLFVDMVPSLLRAFFMFIFGLFLLRNNIKLLSFETLFIVVLIIIALFPKLLFSLSLWFSVAGVFYIFLFLHYFKNLNRYLQFILFNFWIYLAMNPIVHYFFGTTSLEQLYSPLLTLLFTLFYPLVIFLHLIQFGNLFDGVFNTIIRHKIVTIELFTPLYFFLIYIMVSLLSIYSKKIFILLNILLLSFAIYLFI